MMKAGESQTIYPSPIKLPSENPIQGANRKKYQFASDNTAGLCPEAMEALVRANAGSCAAYGEDEWTAEAAQLFRRVFECDCDVYFVFNGTAANSLALASLCQSYHSVITHESAHIETDECGAPEFFSSGTKILLAPGENGKLDLTNAERLVTRRKDIHFPKPKVVSITQPTELGTLYSPRELKEVGSFARRYGLRVHMDGARFAQAVAALGVPPGLSTGRRGWMCCVSAGPNPGSVSARRSSSSTGSFPANSITAVNRAANWHPRCDFWRRRGFPCFGRGVGSGMPPGPTGAPGSSPMVCSRSVVSESYIPVRPTRSSPICRHPFILLCRIEVGIIIPLLEAAGRVSCVPGEQPKEMWPSFCAIVRKFNEPAKGILVGRICRYMSCFTPPPPLKASNIPLARQSHRPFSG